MSIVQFRCKDCHFSYFVEEYEVEQEEKLHKKFHDEYLNGVKAISQKSDDVISEVDGFKVILVSPNSPSLQRKRAERIAFRCKINTHYDFASYHAGDSEQADYPLVFIGVIKNRAIGFLVFRQTKKTAKVRWEEYYNRDEEKKIPLSPDKRWGVSMIWVLENKRRMGYASKLIEIASNYVSSSISEIAWFTPFSKFGYPLAKNFSPHEVILTV